MRRRAFKICFKICCSPIWFQLMSLPHALITALIEHPCSGSELASRFDRSIGYFWHATHQQIYRELGRLEKAGWIASLPQEKGRGRKRAYRVLPAGRKELKRWASEQQDPKPMREELMVRIRAEAAMGSTNIRREIERRIDLHRAKLGHYEMLEARDFPAQHSSRENDLRHLILTAGIMLETSWIEFCELTLKTLAKPRDD